MNISSCPQYLRIFAKHVRDDDDDDDNDDDNNDDNYGDNDDDYIDYPSESEGEKQWYDDGQLPEVDFNDHPHHKAEMSIDDEDMDETKDEDIVENIDGCDVCKETEFVHPSVRLDELDYTFHIKQGMSFSNPCDIHKTCVGCIRASLLNNPMAILKEGNGNFPCLGDSECKTHLGHRTTTYIYQLREFFNDEEWQNISRVSKIYKQNQNHISEFNPYLTPLGSEVNVVSCTKHLERILNQDATRIQCPICQVFMEKTTACYAVRHCDWETCWSCGKIERRLAPNHWINCPRYDNVPFWISKGYKCVENVCHGDDQDCYLPSHVKGRETMNAVRKSYQVVRFIESLPDDVRISLLVRFETIYKEQLKIYSLNKFA